MDCLNKNNKNTIIRGTTPTIRFTFRQVEVSNIIAAYLTIKMNNKTLIERDIGSAIVGNKDLSWTLTQQETLSMANSKIVCQLNWKLADGTRGASKKQILLIENNEKEVVI